MNHATFGDSQLRECLADWSIASTTLAAPSSNGLLERLRQVLSDYLNARSTRSHVDLVALVRQWLLLQVKNAGATWLRVPKGPAWPDRQVWEDAGFNVVSFDGWLELQATKPRLPWLDEQHDLFDDAYDCVQAVTPKWVTAEPVVADPLDMPVFTGAGQREAARSLIHMPSDITLIAALPTGNGKSLLAQLPPLLNGEGYLTLAIVPTVALAIDQGRRMAELFKRKYPDWKSDQFAYHGDLKPEERSAIFRAVGNGTQRVLFTSPEAATGSLRALLEDCAKAGRLTHLVVDEAHLVATWGSGFRPAFQLIPALIARLRSMAPRPIRVVLASATLAAHTVSVLKGQFGPSEKLKLISGIYLRPEPRYAARACGSLTEKRVRVIEALKASPRPFILYVTRPSEAEEWLKILKEKGFERIAQFTGETRSGDRKLLLEKWNRDELDGMIATSAFGLGVDKGNVRAIVHATFPESLDRFYQEVGRSGRDGIASASLLLYTDRDIRQAWKLAGARYIGDELGFQRWTSMIDYSFPAATERGEIWIDLHRLRPELNFRGKANLAWNLRTLNLMAAAGLIEVTALSASRPDESRKSNGDLGETDTAIAYAAVRIPNGDHRSRPAFEAKMHSARTESKRAAREAFQLMLSIARNERAVEDALKELYQLTMPSTWGPVRAYCGGCRCHWPDRSMEPVVPAPFVARLDHFDARPDFKEALRAVPRTLPNLLFVVVDDMERLLHQTGSGLIDALISRLRPHTIAMIRGTPSGQVNTMHTRLRRLRSDAFIDTFDATASDMPAGGMDEVRLIIWSSEVVSSSVNTLLRSSPSAMTVMIIPRTIRDPERPDRLWSSVLTHSDEESVVQALTT